MTNMAKYEFEIKSRTENDFSLGLLPHFDKHTWYTPYVYLVEEPKIVNIKQRTLIWKGRDAVHRSEAEISALAIIDILNCNSSSDINSLLIGKWGYTPMNSDPELWKDTYPRFYETDFETFYSNWMDTHPEYVKECMFADGTIYKQIDNEKYDEQQ